MDARGGRKSLLELVGCGLGRRWFDGGHVGGASSSLLDLPAVKGSLIGKGCSIYSLDLGLPRR